MNKAQLLHVETLKVVKSYKKSESEIIELLMKNDETKAFRTLGYTSLHVYCTKGLNLSDAVAYSLTKIAQKSRSMPEIKTLIQEEKLTISNATQVVRVITDENKDNLLDLAQNLSKREFEKEIKRIHPEAVPREKVRLLTSELEELKVVMTQDLSNDLKFLKDHYSTKAKKSLSLAETLTLMASELRKRHDPVKKAERNFVPGTKLEEQPAKVEGKRVSIPASILHSVHLRDQRRCTFKYVDGSRCENTRWTQTHHKILVSDGGTHTLDNLTTLCTSHHKTQHSHFGVNSYFTSISKFE